MANKLAEFRPLRVHFLLSILLGVPIFAVLFLLSSSGANPQGGSAEYVPGELLVKFHPEVGSEDRTLIRSEFSASARRIFRSGTEHWILGRGLDTREALEDLRENEDVEYVELNLIGRFLDTTPNDPFFEDQWALEQIDAPAAWDMTTGDSDVIVAVLDSGIEYHYPEHDIIVVAGAGNGGEDLDSPSYPGHMPASYDLDNMVVVTSSDPNDRSVSELGHVSAYGEVSVDLAAPGVDILTLDDVCLGDPNCFPTDDHHNDPNELVLFGGTSSGTPHGAGAVGLMRALSPDIPYELVRLQLLDPNSLDPYYPLDPNHAIATNGRLNLAKALSDYDPNSPTAISNLAATSLSCVDRVTLGWSATADDGSSGDPATLYQMRLSGSSMDASNWRAAIRTGGEPTPGSPSSSQNMTIDGLSASHTYYFRLRAFDEWGNGPMSNQVSVTTHAPGGCTLSYCAATNSRCNWTGCSYPSCCTYQCGYDPSCTGPDECPEESCGCF